MAEPFMGLTDVTTAPSQGRAPYNVPLAGLDIPPTAQTVEQPVSQPMPQRFTFDEPALPTLPPEKTFWPTTLAILAAANGNFGPAVQLQEQKRKTGIYQQVPNVLKNTEKLINEGNIDKATTYFQSAISQLGSRAPEIAQFIQPQMAKMARVQEAFQAKDSFIKMEEIKEKLNPNYPEAKKILLKALKQVKTPMDLAMLRSVAESYKGENRLTPDMQIVTSYPDAQHQTKALPLAFEKGDLSDLVAQNIASEFGLQRADAANILRGEPVIIDGEDKSSLFQGALRAKVAQYQAQERDVYLSGKAPTSAEYNDYLAETLKQDGVKDVPLAMATKAFTTDQARKARQLALRDRTALALAPILQDPYGFAKAGIAVVNNNPGSPFFGSPMPPMSYAQQQSDPNLLPIREDIYDKVVTPAISAKAGLPYLDLLFASRGNPTDLFTQIESGVYTTISNYLGATPADANLTKAKVAELMVERAIEQVATSLNMGKDQKDQVVGTLKKQLSGAFANESASRAAIAVINAEIDAMISRKVGDLRIPDQKLPDSVKKDLPKPEVVAPKALQPGQQTTPGGLRKIPRTP